MTIKTNVQLQKVFDKPRNWREALAAHSEFCAEFDRFSGSMTDREKDVISNDIKTSRPVIYSGVLKELISKYDDAMYQLRNARRVVDEAKAAEISCAKDLAVVIAELNEAADKIDAIGLNDVTVGDLHATTLRMLSRVNLND